MPLTPRDRMRLWDAVTGMHPVDAAVRCLAVARPELDDAAALALGDRDAALLALRREVVGDRLTARAACPSCGEEASLELRVSELLEEMAGERQWVLEHDGRTLSVRALTSRDLAAALREGSAEAARRELVRAALGVAADAPDPDDGTSARVAASLVEHDRGAEVLLGCSCAACGTRWHDVLDVARFVTAELAHQGVRLMSEVVELARAFGWPEDAVLDLPDARRRAYLALAAG
ncbi:hypothetical protein [Nocardioides sp. cx-173]|uniref:hypothetical protein n=1 Tax=Nocardioides sp. cx-173 TaxID=2898796 RepID=UPI001E3B27D5|nr:hypothetical protein [Nocardioides sp. cx-173]MCD4525961.1 hypothetical protein [Nocardioides sp. cx-173]UGB43658.1 hypothetical protein LQ940_09065 [Nocardioides sp. cx-173]